MVLMNNSHQIPFDETIAPRRQIGQYGMSIPGRARPRDVQIPPGI